MDLSQFASLMEERARRLPENVNKVKKGVAQRTLTGIAEATPVDTGQAVSNWHVEIDETSGGLFIPPHAPGQHGSTRQANLNATIALGFQSIAKAEPGDTIRIVNNVHYVPDLNNGSSTQAPAGFIEAGVTQGRALLKKAKVIT